MDTSLKRILAFCIDMVIISFITTLIVNYIPLNPNHDKYIKTNEEYVNITKEIGNDEKKAKEYENRIIEINYELYRYRVVDNIISITLLVLYFGVFQMINNGQTLGKKIMNLKVISKGNKKLNFGNYLLRVMFLTNIVISILCIILVYITKGRTFYYISSALGLIQYVLYLTNILMITIKKDNRGLHDLIAGTEVISTKETKNSEQ